MSTGNINYLLFNKHIIFDVRGSLVDQPPFVICVK